jgi:hypothetical protein
MPEFYSQLNDQLRQFIAEQKMFFVATCPDEGRINISPKGMVDTFRVLDDHRVAYLDLTGTGIETRTHLRQNSRMTIMFCSFTSRPLIARLYGQGTALPPGTPGWEELRAPFPVEIGERQVIVLAIESIQTSCGWSVPIFEFKEERHTLRKYLASKEGELASFQCEYNLRSIDGIASGFEPTTVPAVQLRQLGQVRQLKGPGRRRSPR